MEWRATGEQDGRLTLGAFTEQNFKEFLAKHGPVEITLTAVLRESSKMRRWYEGGLVPLITYYQENMDHRNPDHRRQVREWLKVEFNGEIVEIAGTAKKIGRSTSGRDVFYPYVERVQNWFIPNYEPPTEALDPDNFKYWRDAVRSFTNGPDNYIDYLIETGILPPKRV